LAEITLTGIAPAQFGSALKFSQVTGSDYIAPDNADQRLALVFANSGSAAVTVTLLGGSGLGASLGNMNITVAASDTYYLPLSRADTARFKKAENGEAKIYFNEAPASGDLSAFRAAAVSVQ
jgi:hypothetical protein